MRRGRTIDAPTYERAAIVAEEIVSFVNTAFGRRLRAARNLREAVAKALAAGYSEDECRVAFWAARCLPGDNWIRDVLVGDLDPTVVLRFQGGTNPQTGQPAKQWLDSLLSRLDEMNPKTIEAVLDLFKGDAREEQEFLLVRMDVRKPEQPA